MVLRAFSTQGQSKGVTIETLDLSTLLLASTVASATIGIGPQISQNLSGECSRFLDLVVTFATDELHVFEGVAGHRVFSVKYGSVS